MSEFEAIGAAALLILIVGVVLWCAGVLNVSIDRDQDGEG